MTRISFLCVLAFLYFTDLPSQIVNAENLRQYIGKRNFAINSGVNFSYNNNDGTYVSNFGANIASLYKFRNRKDSVDGKPAKLRNKILLHGNYNRIRSEAQDFINNWFIHFRFNKEFTDFFRMEAFIQSQENQLLSISTRNLIGAGVRLKIVETLKDKNDPDSQSLHTYLGFSYMYEYENSDRFNVNFYNSRLSSYLSASLNFGKGKPKLYNTLYVQPLFEDLNNFRLSEEFNADFPFSEKEHLKFTVLFNYFLNNLTPAGDTEFTSILSFGIAYNFKSKLEGERAE